MRRRLCLAASLSAGAAALSACAGSSLGDTLPRGASAYQVIPLASATKPPQDYRIGPMDAIDITVLQEPDLSAKAMQVDAFGRVNLPLIGDVVAGGKTAAQLSTEIAARYGERYLVRPQVAVVVSKPVPQKVIVQGEVAKPGVYEISGPTTLLSALSLAQGETEFASLNEVVVFRNVGGRRMGAIFDVKSIRSGQSEDPEVLSNDTIVVGYSAARRTWKNILSSMPILNIFRPF